MPNGKKTPPKASEAAIEAVPRLIGRPPLPGPKRRDVKLYLPQAAVERLREIGRGSASEGVLRLLAHHGRKAA